MRIHLRSTTYWETRAVRFRDGQIGNESTVVKETQAVVEILGAFRKHGTSSCWTG